MPAPLALLDLDGTLTDSAPGIIGSVRDAYAALGIPAPSDAELRTFVGPPIDENLRGHGVPPERVDEGIAAYRASYAAGGMDDNAVYPGIEAALVALRQAGVTLAVATSKPQPFAEAICARLGLAPRLDAVFGASMDGSRTTKAAVVAHALAGLGIGSPVPAGAPVVMVGDREHDVHGARAHGIDCVGAGWGYAAPGELLRAGAVTVLDAPGALAAEVLARLR